MTSCVGDVSQHLGYHQTRLTCLLALRPHAPIDDVVRHQAAVIAGMCRELCKLSQGVEALTAKVDAIAVQVPQWGDGHEGCDHCGDPSGGAKYCPACAVGHRDD